MAKIGRPRIEIDWKQFDKLAGYWCTQNEIADFFGCSPDTLEAACLRDHGVPFPDYFSQKKNAGKSRLRKIQFDLAEQGSTAMAIFLGKHLLGQSDQPIDQAIMNAVQKAGLTKDQAIEYLLMRAQEKAKLNKRSFEEFSEIAGYPKPFEKQVEMMRFGIEEEEARLLLGARGYGKTDYVVILGIAYDLYLNPFDSTNLIMSKSKERNSAMIQEIKAACEKNGMVFEKANASMLRVQGLLGKDHSVSAVTIKTVSLRGRHPKRVIMDDPVTEDDTSDATRLLVEKKYNEVQKLTSNVLVIGQPAHKFDLYAKLRPLLKKMEVPHGTIPELDHDIEAQRLAGVDESSIQASYFLKILSEGATPFDNIQYMDSFPHGDSVAFIDPSHEGGDFTAISIIKAHMSGVAAVGFMWKKAWNHCLDDIAPLLTKYHVRKLAFESNSLGDMPVDILRQTFQGVGVVGRRTVTNKHSRIMAAGAFAHQIFLARDSSKAYIDQVVQYEYKAKHDDAPDSLATCLEWIGLVRGK